LRITITGCQIMTALPLCPYRTLLEA